MYAKLKKPYALRGFQGIPHTLVNVENGKTDFLNGKGFQLLSLCDGTVDLDMVLLDKDQREYLRDAVQNHVVQMTDQPEAIEECQKYRKAANKYIRSIHWSVTGRCNLKCRHCYMCAPDYKYHDLKTEECFLLIEQFREANVSTVSITGGEPFIRKDIFQIMEKIYAEGMGINQIYTNGLLLNEEILNWFEERGKNPQFVLSFDCVGCHDWMRGVYDVEKPTIEAIRLLKKYGFTVMIETALCEKNLKFLTETYELLKECGIDYWKTSLIFEAGNWKKQDEKSVTEEELYEEYLKLIKRYFRDKAPLSIQLDGFFACEKGNIHKYECLYEISCDETTCRTRSSCQTCRTHPYLLPDGTFLPCPSMTDSEIEKDMPNLLNETIQKIYSDDKHPFFRLSNIKVGEVLAANQKCQECEFKYKCGGGCRAMSLFAGNGIMGYSPVLCLFFQKNYKERIRAISSEFL